MALDSSSPLIIGVAGGSGSGKTTVARRILAGLPPGRAALIQVDWYYRDLAHLPFEERATANFDEPDALDLDLLGAHLEGLSRGEPAACPQYDFTTHCRLPDPTLVRPAPVIVVEGILLFAAESLRRRLDLRIFVDTDADIRLMRRIRRDLQERGRDIDAIQEQYYRTVRPMHQLHVAPTRQYAHLVVPEGGENRHAVDVIVGHLLHRLTHAVDTLVPMHGDDD